MPDVGIMLCISSGAGMPACRTWESCPLYLVRRRHAGRGSGHLCISSSAGMPACRTWEWYPLYLVRRRHAGMPDVGIIPSVPACRHEGRDKEGTTPTSGMPACRRRTRYRGHDSHIRHAGARRDTEGMTPTSGMPACWRRTRYRGHDSYVRHAGMLAPDEIHRA